MQGCLDATKAAERMFNEEKVWLETNLEGQKERIGIQEQYITDLQQQLDAVALDCVSLTKELRESEQRQSELEEKLQSETSQTLKQSSEIINLEDTVLQLQKQLTDLSNEKSLEL